MLSAPSSHSDEPSEKALSSSLGNNTEDDAKRHLVLKIALDGMETHSTQRLGLALTNTTLRNHYTQFFGKVDSNKDALNPSDTKTFLNLKQSFDRLHAIMEECAVECAFESINNPSISDYFELYTAISNALQEETQAMACVINKNSEDTSKFNLAAPIFAETLSNIFDLLKNEDQPASLEQLLKINQLLKQANITLAENIIQWQQESKFSRPVYPTETIMFDFANTGLTRLPEQILIEKKEHFALNNLSLHLHGNFLKTLPTEIFKLPQLKKLICTNNQIRVLPWAAINEHSFNDSTKLVLSENHIQRFPKGFESFIPTLFLQKQAINKAGNVIKAKQLRSAYQAQYGENHPAYQRLAEQWASRQESTGIRNRASSSILNGFSAKQDSESKVEPQQWTAESASASAHSATTNTYGAAPLRRPKP